MGEGKDGERQMKRIKTISPGEEEQKGDNCHSGRTGDLVSSLFAYLQNGVERLSSTQWFSAPNSVILGVKSTCIRIFMHKVVAVFLTPSQQKKEKKRPQAKFLDLESCCTSGRKWSFKIPIPRNISENDTLLFFWGGKIPRIHSLKV